MADPREGKIKKRFLFSILLLGITGGRYAIPESTAAPDSRPSSPLVATLVESFERREFNPDPKYGREKYGGSGVSLTFELTGPVADKVARIAHLHFIEAVDDHGNSLMPPQRWDWVQIEKDVIETTPHFSFYLDDPPRSSTKIRHLRATLKVVGGGEHHVLEFPWNKWTGKVLEDPILRKAGLRIRITSGPSPVGMDLKLITLHVEGNSSAIANVDFYGPDKGYLSTGILPAADGDWEIEQLMKCDPASLIAIDVGLNQKTFEIPIDLVNVLLP